MRQTAMKHGHWLAPAAALGSALALAAGLAAAPANAAPPPRQTVTGSHPSWASPAAAVNQVPADTTLSARLYLAGRDPGSPTRPSTPATARGPTTMSPTILRP
jgi:hypothetical protein